MTEIQSRCLPYFSQDKASIFLLNGRKIRVPIFNFQDVTSEGGRFHQFHTFLIGRKASDYQRRDKDVQPEDQRGFNSKDLPESQGKRN